MEDIYARLLAEWKRASAQTRSAQVALKERFEAHLRNEGAAPDPAEVDRLMRLREVEADKLHALLEHVASAARGTKMPRDAMAPER